MAQEDDKEPQERITKGEGSEPEKVREYNSLSDEYTARSTPAYGIIPTNEGVSPLNSARIPSFLLILIKQSHIPLYSLPGPPPSASRVFVISKGYIIV
eukprot:CAMPEP_0174255552 /NCGR_PEP_ID=MMETSP0439-20130205/4874_1 /TAXON_ID=0 /ORGANISM="Stereomyxa ramosa, Strain Chinc5" /LENGTH=97 /DNA_ID=CAMNT_0015337779 /DNA_START=178 /DNA_END=471 /DNA_ORIENTATION=-